MTEPRSGRLSFWDLLFIGGGILATIAWAAGASKIPHEPPPDDQAIQHQLTGRASPSGPALPSPSPSSPR